MAPAALVLLAALQGLAADPRMAALIVPLDAASEQVAPRIEAYAHAALQDYPGFALKGSEELFGLGPDEASTAALGRTQKGAAESRAAFEARSWESAERSLRATLQDFGLAAGALKGPQELAEVLAMYAAVQQARGELDAARATVLDLLAVAPGLELDRRRFPQALLALRAQVAASRSAQLRGNVQVRSRPAGARVYLGAEFQCFTPCTLSTLRLGKQLVRVERPGFRTQGTLLEVTPEDREYAPELVATAAYQAFEALMDPLAGEALKNKGGGTMRGVASALKLDRALLGVLREVDGQTELVLGYWDLAEGRRFSVRRAAFQGEEFGQLEGEVARLVTALLNAPSAEKVVHSSDPLRSHQGTEDWSADDRGGKNQQRQKKQTGDPLKKLEGTEDW
jgi:PEGA domain